MNQLQFSKTQSKEAKRLKQEVVKELCEMGKLGLVNDMSVFRKLEYADFNEYAENSICVSELANLIALK